MLATVFSMQSFGQLLSAIVACKAVGSIWRWIYGAGAIPAAIAQYLRLTIPESPRYTFDVAQNPAKLDHDLDFLTRWHNRKQGSSESIHDLTASAENQATSYPLQPEIPVPRCTEPEFPPMASLEDIKNYFIVKGNWLSLLGTAGAWMLLDLSFFGLGLNSLQIWYL